VECGFLNRGHGRSRVDSLGIENLVGKTGKRGPDKGKC
jgi:hypothetical protein